MLDPKPVQFIHALLEINIQIGFFGDLVRDDHALHNRVGQHFKVEGVLIKHDLHVHLIICAYETLHIVPHFFVCPVLKISDGQGMLDRYDVKVPVVLVDLCIRPLIQS